MLRVEPTFLRSKVARRVFLLFVCSAFAPVLVIVLVAIGQLNGLLEQLAYRELSAANKSYGMSVLERLATIEGAAATITANIRDGRSPEAAAHSALILTQSMRIARTAALEPLTPEVRRQLASGKAVISVSTNDAGSARALMWRAIDPTHLDRGLLVFEPDPLYLWGEEDSQPYLTDICVLDSRGRALFCTLPISEAARTELITAAGNNTAHLAWHNNGQEYIAVQRTLFLKGRFIAPSWTVIFSRPKSVPFASLDTIRGVFLPAFVASLLLVTLLTVIQVRRLLVPLERLTQATRRIGNQDFSTMVTVNSGDEFEELAHALNSMTARLGRQFSALALWSAADRAILSGSSIDLVLEPVVNGLSGVLRADVLGVTVVDDTKLGLGRTYVRSADAGARVVVERTELSAAEIARLTAQTQPEIYRSDDRRPAFLETFFRAGATSTFVLSVVSRDELIAVIGLGYQGTPRFVEDDRVHARNLADRVAVALSAAEREEQLYRQAHYDSLTGLPNRNNLKDRITQEFARAQRERRRLALLYIDLDRFKDVNDTLGHAAGDRLLQTMAARLLECVRDTDTVARLSGDEFAVVLGDVASPHNVQHVAEKIIRDLSLPVSLEGNEMFTSCSVGGALYPDDGLSGEELLRKADTAMYRAKQKGRGQFMFFEAHMNVEELERVALEQDLRRALERDEFVLLFQPQVDLRFGAVIGAEVLLRWKHPTRGLLGPDQFIPVAEQTGIVDDIGSYVLRRACEQYSRWHAEGYAPPLVSVNVSSRQFRQIDFWQTVRATLAATNMSSTSLTLEVTESLLLEGSLEVKTNFNRLRDMGVRLAIDDFGMGYSSLAYLKRLPIDSVKIDRAFMHDVPASDDAGTIVSMIVSMAGLLKKEVIAEGVETEDQIAFLLGKGCYLAQGFGISVPLSAEDFSAYMLAGRDTRRKCAR